LTVPKGQSLSREQIVAALSALGAQLQAQGVRGQIFIVGGAAMTLAYSERRLTRDIDAAFEPKAVIYEAAARVSRDLNLPQDWLNDAVKGFMPGPDQSARPIPEIAGIEVSVASPQYLLAMKLLAMRIGEDDDDIKVLLRECGITTAEEAVALVERMYPQGQPLPKTRFWLEEYFGG
jgi:hypothetical protein